jgi:uncharacterized membrane protein
MFACLSAAVLLSAASTGCTKNQKPESGKSASKDVVVSARDFTLTVHEGFELTHKLRLDLERGAEAKNEVSLSVEGGKNGVTATIEPDKVGPDKEAYLIINVASDATPGDIKLTVTAKSEGSKNSTDDVVVKVKPTLDIVMIDKSLTVKQGGKGTANVSLKFGADVGKSAKLNLSATVKDKENKEVKGVAVTLDPDTLSTSGGSTVTVMVGEDVVPGDFEMWVAAQGLTLNPRQTKISLKVEKK